MWQGTCVERSKMRRERTTLAQNLRGLRGRRFGQLGRECLPPLAHFWSTDSNGYSVLIQIRTDRTCPARSAAAFSNQPNASRTQCCSVNRSFPCSDFQQTYWQEICFKDRPQKLKTNILSENQNRLTPDMCMPRTIPSVRSPCRSFIQHHASKSLPQAKMVRDLTTTCAQWGSSL